MIEILLALWPVAALIAIGNILRRTGFLVEEFWEDAGRLVFFVLFPALLFDKTARADLGSIAVGPMASVVIIAIVVVAFLCVATRSFIRINGRDFSALFQGAIQQNTYIGFAAATGLLGAAGDVASVVAAAVMVPLVNALSVVVLARTATGKKGKSSGWLRVPGAVLGHPLIIALAIGWVFNYAGLGAVTPIGQVTEVLGQGALPVALLCVGAGLRLSVLREAEAITFVSVALKMVVMPALAFIACLVVRLDGAAAIVAIMFAALPTSATAYMLSRRMGGHHDLVAVIMSVETLVAAVTIPAAVLVANIVFGPLF